MEKKIRYGNLFAFYGKLLTEKQYEMLYYYYLNDYSMVEIAENMKISRQAVYDAVRKSDKALDYYETKMGLYEKFKRISNYSNSIIENSKRVLENENNEDKRNEVYNIVKLATEIIQVNDN
jgi:predicted DNA-binding protein YlxM (UPF0122 family)